MGVWLDRITNKFKCRNRLFNSVVATTPYELDEIAEQFSSIFGNITAYRDELASIKLYPFYIKATDDTPTTQTGQYYSVLRGSKGTNTNIRAIRIDEKATLMNIGYIKVPHLSSNFLDYNGYTKYSLFLPYFSTIDIDASIFVDNYIVVRLAVDFFTGQGMYIISMSKEEPTYIENNTYYTYGEETNEIFISNYVFDLGIDIPKGDTNYGDIKRNLVLGVVKTAGTLIAASYGMALPPSTVTESYEDVSIASARGDYKGARMIPRSMTESSGSRVTTYHTPKNELQPISQSISSGLSILNNNFRQGHGDRANNSMNMWSYNNIPCLYIYRPNVDRVTDEYRKLKGLPLGFYVKLSQVGGFTKICNIRTENFTTATLEEISRIHSMLKEGVILPYAEEIDFRVDGVLYSTSNGFTWEQFVKTQPEDFRLEGVTSKRVYHRYNNEWILLDVDVDDVIEENSSY